MYDAEFRKSQQFSLSILREFGFGQNVMENRIHSAVEDLITKLKLLNGGSIDPSQYLFKTAEAILSGVLFGNHMDESYENDRQIFDTQIFDTCGRFIYFVISLMPLDILPFLRFLPNFRKLVNEALDTNKKALKLLNFKVDQILSCNSTDNFVSRYVQEAGKDFDREHLLYLLRNFVVAGSETSSVTIRFAIILLANYRKVQKRLQEEIDSVVPVDRLPSIADKSKLRYVEAVILELMRHKTLGSTAFPHKTAYDTEVAGYFVPKNTTVCTA